MALLVQQRRVKPRGWIVRVEAAGEFQFAAGQRVVAGVVECLAEITAEHGAIRFERGGDEKIGNPGLRFTTTNPAQAATQPGVAQCGINANRLVEGRDGLLRSMRICQQEATNGMGLGVARCELQRAFDCRAGRCAMAETELQFRQSRPGEGEMR